MVLVVVSVSAPAVVTLPLVTLIGLVLEIEPPMKSGPPKPPLPSIDKLPPPVCAIVASS